MLFWLETGAHEGATWQSQLALPGGVHCACPAPGISGVLLREAGITWDV